MAVQLVDGALPTADVPDEDRRVEAAGEEPRPLAVPCECLYKQMGKGIVLLRKISLESLTDTAGGTI